MKVVRFVSFCSLLGVLVAVPAAAQALKVAQISYPGATGTYAAGVNATNKVVGIYTTATATLGFEWTGGTNYKPILFRGSNNFTRALGINDGGEIVGDFLGKDTYYHGFTLVGTKYTQYDVPGGLGHFSTSLFGIDKNGDLAGAANGQGFVSIGGVVSMFYGSGTDLTYAYGINVSGVAVGQYFDSSNKSHGFTWQAGTVTEVVYPGATQTACEGINDAGEITGYYIDSAGAGHGFTLSSGVYTTSDLPFIEGVNSKGTYVGWYTGPGGVAYGFLASPATFKPAVVKVKNAQSTSTYGTNNAGVLVGQYTNSKGVTHGLMLSGATVTNIDDPKATAGGTTCEGINTSNQIVGWYTSSATGQSVGFYYAAGTFTDIPGPAGAVSSVAYNISDTGQITGTFTDASNNSHGFLLSGVGGTYTQLDVPGGSQTYVWGINASGTVSVGWVDSKGYWEASLYNGTTYTSVNVPGALHTFIHSINKNGDAVYAWQDSAFNYHGAVLSGGSYYLLDVPGGSQTHADGITDTGVIVGRNLQPGSATNYNGFKGMK